MARIFAQAREVIVGLGDEIDTDMQAIHVLTQLSALPQWLRRSSDLEQEGVADRVRDVIGEIEMSGGWDAVAALFRDGWWHRLWVIQEIVLAANVVAVVGSLSFSFIIIEQAISAVSSAQNLVNFDSASFARLKCHPGWVAAGRIMLTRAQWQLDGGLPLHAMLWRFRYQHCILSGDKVYGLLGISRQSDAGKITIDYSRPFSETATAVARTSIVTYDSLDLFSICSGYEQQGQPEPMPTWVPSWNTPSARKPLVLGHFEWPQQSTLYTASKPHQSFRLEFLEPKRAIVVRGRIFDVVEFIEYMTDPDEGGWNHQGAANPQLGFLFQRLQKCLAQISSVEVRWRTLLADQWPLGRRLGSNVFRGHPVPTSEAEEKKLLSEPDLQNDMPFLEGRSIMGTADGYLGLCPEEAQVGDEIAVIEGGAVPYVLRRFGEEYQLVGECYIHGCMDGEVLARMPRAENGDWTRELVIV